MMNPKRRFNQHIRQILISEVLVFIQKAVQLSGINRIAMIGSLTTSKPNPKDIDYW